MSPKELVNCLIKSHKVVVFSKTSCSFCRMAKSSLTDSNIKFEVLEIDSRDDCDSIQDILGDMTGARSVPRVFINGKCIGGGTETRDLCNNGKINQLVA